MFLTDVDADEAGSSLDEDPRSSTVAVVVATALKTTLAAMAGFVLTSGLGLLIWAVTPSSGSGPLPLLRAGISAFAAANGMTLKIGRSGLTLPPLMLTLVVVALLTTVVGRGRLVARGRDQEGAAVATSALSWAVVVTGIGAEFGGGTVSAAQWWRPAMMALIVVGVATLIRSDGWRSFLLDRVPMWVPVAVRCGAAAVVALLGGGAVTLVIGLIRTFGHSVTVQTLAAPGAAGGLGMALLGIAYLPNAVVAATGYSTGVGFTIGSGTYTPFGSSPVELPAVSLLTAAPDGHAFARPTLLLLVFPVLAAALIGRGVVRRLDTRRDRLFAAGGAALFAAVLSAVVAEVAAGGVTGGEWSNTGVPPVLFGLVVLAGFGVISAAVVVLAKVPAREVVTLVDADMDAADGADASTDVAVDDEAVDDTAVDEVTVDEVTVNDVAVDDAVDEEAVVQADTDDVVVDETVDEEDVAGDNADDEVDPTPPVQGPLEDPGSLETEVLSDEAVDERVPTAVEADPFVPSGIPTPREEDVVAGELVDAEDPDATLAAGLSRRAAPRRTG